MEESEHSLVPQWLKSSGSVSRVASTNSQLASSPCSDHIPYSGSRWRSSRKGSGISRSYNSSQRSLHDRDWENEIDYFFNKDKLFIDDCNHDRSDHVDKVLSSRFGKGILPHSECMNSGRWKETLSPRTTGDVISPQRNHGKSDGMAIGVVGIMHKTMLDEEFPLLGAEDKHGSSELGRVLSSSSSTSSHTLLTGTSAVIVSNNLTSAAHEIPINVGSSSSSSMTVRMHQHTVSGSTSSIAPSTMGLSMAETLAQSPPRSHTPPQISVGTQKLEELALKQSRLLIPMTPSTPRSLVASPSEKLKVKTGQQQYPFLYSRPPSHSPRGVPANSDVQKISPGNFRNVGASQELNGVSSAVKDNLSPSRSRLVLSPTGATTSTSIPASSRSSSNNSPPSNWITLEKRPTFQTQSRSDFFKNLSRKNSSKNPCADVCSNGMSCDLEKSEAGTGNAACAVTSLTESSCIITENGSAASEPLKFSSNGEQRYKTNPVLYPDEEEIAFLHSLGWEESAGDDEGLTEEEIRDFYEKYMKLQPSSNILRSAHQNTTALPLDSSSGEHGGAHQA